MLTEIGENGIEQKHIISNLSNILSGLLFGALIKLLTLLPLSIPMLLVLIVPLIFPLFSVAYMAKKVEIDEAKTRMMTNPITSRDQEASVVIALFVVGILFVIGLGISVLFWFL